jgi:hypothetical protein
LGRASLKYTCDLLDRRLRDGYGVVVSMHTAGANLVLLHGNDYWIVPLPKTEAFAFAKAIRLHRMNQSDLKDFARVLENYRPALLQTLSAFLDDLVSSASPGLIFLPDRLDSVPIMLPILAHTKTRERMRDGRFQVRVCPILYPRRASECTNGHLLALTDTHDQLLLSRAELNHAINLLSPASYAMIRTDQHDEFLTEMQRTDTLLVAHHGFSIANYLDPTMAGIRGPQERDAISFGAIQEQVYKWPVQFVSLGLCHGTSTTARNYQHEFVTHDLAGFAPIFLSNRRCSVLGAMWRSLDKVSFLVSHLLCCELRDGRDIGKAYNVAIAKLGMMSGEDALEVFRLIEDAEIRKTLLSETSAERIEAMLATPYASSAYHLFTLV